MNAVLRIVGIWWRSHRTALLVGVAVSLAALGAAVLLMMASASLLAFGSVGATVALPLLLRVLGPARVVLRYLERLATHSATFRALASLRVWFFRGVARQGAGGLGFRRSGDLLSRLVNDVEALDGLYLRVIVPMCGALALAPVLLIWIGRRQPGAAAAVTVLFAVAAFGLPALAAGISARGGRQLADAGAALRVAALDATTGLREVRVYGAEHRVAAAIGAAEATLFEHQRRLARRGTMLAGLAFLAGQAAILILLWRADRDPVFTTVSVFLAVAAFELAGALPRAGVLAGHAAGAAGRVLQAADGPIAAPAMPDLRPKGHQVDFSMVRFRWAADRAAVFEGLTLHIPAGARVALLGPSGSGKSTLAALLLKVVRPDAGAVSLGGIDLAELDAAFVRSQVAWLSQATHLFDDTIRANLLLGRPDATDAALWAALDAAVIGDVVRGLPDGLDGWVGEGGTRFSGGQARRLALARTLLSTAPILVLDEPGAGLDADTERAFLATLNDVATGRSVILITHRLTGVERLDRIYRLSGGHAIAAAA